MKLLRRFFQLIPVLLLSLVIAACSTPAKEVSKFGNTNGNIANAGISVTNGDWIYFININAENALYKIKKDRTGEALVTAQGGFSLNFYDGWIFYCNALDNFRIYRIRPDGTESRKLGEMSAQNMIVYDGWIWYVDQNGADGLAIYKMKLDGTEAQRVGTAKTGQFNLTEEYIYYSGDGAIRRMKLDGTSDTELIKTETQSFQVVGDHIYYIENTNELNRMWRMKLDGTDPVKLSDEKVASMNVSGDWIYYGNTKTEGLGLELKKMKLDGTGSTRINEDGPVIINLHGDTMVYLAMDLTSFSIKETILNIDGSNRKDYTRSAATNQPQASFKTYNENEPFVVKDLKFNCLSALTTNYQKYGSPEYNKDPYYDRVVEGRLYYVTFEITNPSEREVILDKEIAISLGEGSMVWGQLADISSRDNKDIYNYEFMGANEYKDSVKLEPEKTRMIQMVFYMDMGLSPIQIGIYGDNREQLAAINVNPAEGIILPMHEDITQTMSEGMFPKSEVRPQAPRSIAENDVLELFYPYEVIRPDGKKEFYLIKRGTEELYEGQFSDDQWTLVKKLEKKNFDE